MRARKNQTTVRLLGILANGSGTAQGIAKQAAIPVPRASMTLLNLFRAGHVSRATVREGDIIVDEEERVTRPRYVFVYSLTKKGLARLERLGSMTVPARRRK